MRAESLNQAARTGGSIVRINVRWAQIAPKSPPTGFVASDPSSAGYDWASLDTVIADATAHRQKVLLMVFQAPAWAEGEKAPKQPPQGSWEPSRAALRGIRASAWPALQRHLPRPEPIRSETVCPRSKYFEAWNEPNLEEYLAPQWNGGENRAANLYRGLLNSFYAG